MLAVHNWHMLSFETALRLVIVGQELLIAAIFLYGSGNLIARISGALLLVSVSAYLLVSDVVLREAVVFFLPVLWLLTLLVPYWLWLFARAIFEAPWPNPWITSGFVLLAAGVWLTLMGQDSDGSERVTVANIAMDIASLVVVGHALLIAAKGISDDLIEQRRKFRVYFIAIVAVQVANVLAIELLLGESIPGWLNFLNVSVIAALTIGLAVPLLRLSPDFFAPVAVQGEGPVSRVTDELRPAELVLKRVLLSAMSEGVYRQSGLTIRVLADRLGCPEHQLRKLINGRLDFRNFSAFLNSYRIPEAKSMLADSGQVRTQVLTIALDLGYGSLGPFNRAFKSATNMTPTEYRQKTRSPKSSENE